MKRDITGLVMAGGQSRRMGKNKAFLEINGQSLIKIVLARMAGICQEIFIVVNEPEEYQSLGYPVIADEVPRKGPLGGLLTGLKNASYNTCLMVATDMPFINTPLLVEMADLIDGFDVVIPRNERGFEPLHACYSQKCLPAIEKAMQQQKSRIISFFDRVNVKVMEEIDWKSFDPEGLFFFNINKKEDLDWAEQIICPRQ